MPNSTVYTSAGAVDAPTPLGKRNPLWTPALLPGVVSDWDCDTGIVTVDDDANSGTPELVNSWTDSIGGKVLAGTTTTRPTREGNLNGRTPVRLVSGKFLTIPAITISADKLYAFVLNVTTSSATVQTLFSGNGGSTGTESINLQHAGGGFGASLTGGTLISGATLAAALHVVVLYKDSSDNNWKLRIDGAQVASASRTGIANIAGGFLGKYNSGGAQPTLDTSVARIVLAAGAQALLDVQKLEGMLAARFAAGVFLPNGHPYRNTPPRKLS